MDEDGQTAVRPAPSGNRRQSWKEIADHVSRGVSSV
jgi:hypothetical protein